MHWLDLGLWREGCGGDRPGSGTPDPPLLHRQSHSPFPPVTNGRPAASPCLRVSSRAGARSRRRRGV
jgi:hypothetical protein